MAVASHVVGVDQQGRDGLVGFLAIPKGLDSRVRLLSGRLSQAIVRAYAPFDGILCVDVLEHVPDDEGFLRDLGGVCTSDGRLLLHVPAAPQWHPIRPVREELNRMLVTGDGQHVREGYSLASLTAVLAAAGWRVLEARATFGRIAAWWCDADFLLAGRRSRALRIAAIPVTIMGGMMAAYWTPTCGNGWLLLAER